MKRRDGIAILIAAALLCSAAGAGFGAAAPKAAGVQRNKAAQHISERGAANTNAQWSADPERGWVHAEERHRLNEKSERSNKDNSGQRNGKRKTPKRKDR